MQIFSSTRHGGYNLILCKMDDSPVWYLLALTCSHGAHLRHHTLQLPPLWKRMCAGTTSGVIGAMLSNPADTMLIRMQVGLLQARAICISPLLSLRLPCHALLQADGHWEAQHRRNYRSTNASVAMHLFFLGKPTCPTFSAVPFVDRVSIHGRRHTSTSFFPLSKPATWECRGPL